MKHKYTVITDSGNAKLYDGKELSQVIDALFTDYQSGGSTYDYPKALYRDGNLIVNDRLSDIVYNLGTMKRKGINEVFQAYERAINNAIVGLDKI